MIGIPHAQDARGTLRPGFGIWEIGETWYKEPVRNVSSFAVTEETRALYARQ